MRRNARTDRSAGERAESREGGRPPKTENHPGKRQRRSSGPSHQCKTNAAFGRLLLDDVDRPICQGETFGRQRRRLPGGVDLAPGASPRLPRTDQRPLQPPMSQVQVSASERWPKRFRRAASWLLVVAILVFHGIGRATEAGATARGQGALGVVESDALLTAVPSARDHWPVHAAASTPRVPRPDAARLGGGDCCKSPTCRCGCPYPMAALAIAALGDRSSMSSP